MPRKYLARGVFVEKTEDTMRFVVGGEVVKEIKTSEPLNELTIKKYFGDEKRIFAPNPMEAQSVSLELMRKLEELEERISRIEQYLSSGAPATKKRRRRKK